MSTSNVETIRTVYEAFGRGDVPTILEQFSDDVDFGTDAADPVAPWQGRRRGKEGVASFLQALAETLDVLEFEPLSFAAGDDVVHTLVRWGCRYKENGREAHMLIHHYWHFRDGRIDVYHGSEDTAQTEKMVG